MHHATPLGTRSTIRIIEAVCAVVLFLGTGCDERDSGPSPGENADTWSSTRDVQLSCDAVALPCCDESGDYVTTAQCTSRGLECPNGTHHDEECSLYADDAGSGPTDTSEGSNAEDGGDTVGCDAIAIPCCDDAGSFVANKMCTSDGLECPAGTHHDDQCSADEPDAHNPEDTDQVDTGPDAKSDAVN